MESAVVYGPIRCPNGRQFTDVAFTRREIAASVEAVEPFIVDLSH